MVYAVAHARRSRTFDRALGRRVRLPTAGVLQLLPHAFRGENAFYDPRPARGAVRLLPGRRERSRPEPARASSSSRCLSHDIVAHEVTHAIVAPAPALLLRADEPRRPGLPRGARRPRRDLPALHASPSVLARHDPATTRTDLHDPTPLVRAGPAVRLRDRAPGVARGRADRPARPDALPDDVTSRTRAVRSSSPRCSTPSSRSTSDGSRTSSAWPPAAPGIARRGRCTPTWSAASPRRPRERPSRVLTMASRALDYLPPVRRDLQRLPPRGRDVGPRADLPDRRRPADRHRSSTPSAAGGSTRRVSIRSPTAPSVLESCEPERRASRPQAGRPRARCVSRGGRPRSSRNSAFDWSRRSAERRPVAETHSTARLSSRRSDLGERLRRAHVSPAQAGARTRAGISGRRRPLALPRLARRHLPADRRVVQFVQTVRRKGRRTRT